MMTIIVLWILLGIIAFIVIVLHFSFRAYLRIDENGFDFNVKYFFFTIYPRQKKAEKTVKQKDKKDKLQDDKTSQEDLFNDDLDEDFAEPPPAPKPTEEIILDNNMTEGVQHDITEAEQKSDVLPEDEKKQHLPEEQTKEENTVENADEPNNSAESAAESVDENIIKELNKKPKDKENSQHKDAEKKGKFDKIKEQYYKYKPYIPMGWKYFKKLLKAIRITDINIDMNIGRRDAHEAAIYYGTLEGLLFNTLAYIANIFTVKVDKADVNCIFTENTFDGEGECYVKVRPSTIIAIAVCIGINFLFIYLRHRDKKPDKNNKEKNNADNTDKEKAEVI